MIVATAIASIVIFLIALSRSGVVAAAGRVLESTRASMAVMRDPALDDRDRERAIQRSSLQLFAGCGSILLRGGLSLAASLVPIALVSASGLAAADDIFTFLTRADVIAVSTMLVLLAYALRARLWPSI